MHAHSTGLTGEIPASLIHMIESNGCEVLLEGNPGLTLPLGTLGCYADTSTRFLLDGIKLAGTIGPLGSLPLLKVVSMERNCLEGTIEPLQGLTEMITLRLSHNLIGGTLQVRIPRSTCAISSAMLCVSDSSLIPATLRSRPNPLHQPLAALVKMVHLDLAVNNLTGPLESLATLTSLTYLNLRKNRFVGSLTPLASLESLKYLNVAQNDLVGEVLPLVALRRLVTVELWSNRLNGSVEPLVLNLDRLECLVLNNPDYCTEAGNTFDQLEPSSTMRRGKHRRSDSTSNGAGGGVHITKLRGGALTTGNCFIQFG